MPLADLQVDALRAKLAAAEKAAVESARKEAELAAQVSVLMANMASTQQQHAKVCVCTGLSTCQYSGRAAHCLCVAT
jgi:hypothetical protein